MKTRTIMTLVVGAAGLCGASLLQSNSSTAAPGERLPNDLVWLALGDSYSSGEGLQFVDATANPPDKNCERANGTSNMNNGAGSRAYAAVAYDELRGGAQSSTFRLLACTGAISNEVHSQFDEWDTTEGRRADLITMTMGGNDLGFADVIYGCIGVSFEGGFAAAATGLSPAAWALNPFIGCTTTEDTIRTDIATLIGDSGVGPNGGQTLPDMYRELAKNSMNQGGHVVVVGYPNLVEESSRWAMWWLEGNRCSRIRRADAAMLRSATGELNVQLFNMVERLNTENLGVTFHWLDASQEYENADGRHGLCTGSPWINGITFGVAGAEAPVRFQRSFHPTQDGHDHVGRALADIVAGLDWSSLQRATIEASTTNASGDCVASPILYVGMSGKNEEIALYQRTLIAAGYDPGEPDGFFGAQTWNAAGNESRDNSPHEDPFVELWFDGGEVLRPVFERLGIACDTVSTEAPCVSTNEAAYVLDQNGVEFDYVDEVWCSGPFAEAVVIAEPDALGAAFEFTGSRWGYIASSYNAENICEMLAERDPNWAC